jgi:hypothetical protein
MIFFSGDGFWQREAVIHNQQVVETGIKIDTAVHNILSAARYGIDKDDEKVRICMAKVRFTDDLAAIDQILSSHAENARQNLKFALNSEPLKVPTSRINRARMRIDNISRLAVLNSHSPALTGNNVRHAGSNSLPRSDPRSGLRRGPNPDSVDSFLARFESSSLGSGGTQTVSRIALLADLRWPCVSCCGAAAPPMDDVQKCCSFFWSVCRAAEAARR